MVRAIKNGSGWMVYGGVVSSLLHAVGMINCCIGVKN